MRVFSFPLSSYLWSCEKKRGENVIKLTESDQTRLLQLALESVSQRMNPSKFCSAAQLVMVSWFCGPSGNPHVCKPESNVKLDRCGK